MTTTPESTTACASVSPASNVSNKGWLRALGLSVIITVVLVSLIRTVPFADPTLGELWQRLVQIDSGARELRTRPASSDEWKAFLKTASPELKELAGEVRSVQKRRSGPLRWFVKMDQRTDAAWREVLRIAEGDLPALLASGLTGNPQREKDVRTALDGLDDHLAGASPFIPPLKPVEIQNTLARRRRMDAVRKFVDENQGALIFGGQVLLMVAGWGGYRLYRRRKQSSQNQEPGSDELLMESHP